MKTGTQSAVRMAIGRFFSSVIYASASGQPLDSPLPRHVPQEYHPHGFAYAKILAVYLTRKYFCKYARWSTVKGLSKSTGVKSTEASLVKGNNAFILKKYFRGHQSNPQALS